MWYVSGNCLAELQLQVIWEEILKRFPDIQSSASPSGSIPAS